MYTWDVHTTSTTSAAKRCHWGEPNKRDWFVWVIRWRWWWEWRQWLWHINLSGQPYSKKKILYQKYSRLLVCSSLYLSYNWKKIIMIFNLVFSLLMEYFRGKHWYLYLQNHKLKLHVTTRKNWYMYSFSNILEQMSKVYGFWQIILKYHNYLEKHSTYLLGGVLFEFLTSKPHIYTQKTLIAVPCVKIWQFQFLWWPSWSGEFGHGLNGGVLNYLREIKG